MALEEKRAMEKYYEAPGGCLQNNIFPCNLQFRGNHAQGSMGSKDELIANTGGGIMVSNGKFSHVSSVPHDMWPYFYPDFHKVQLNSIYAHEAHHYPTGYEYGFPYDKPFQGVPFWMTSQSFQSDVNLQEFQYFVVIDFEATCDKDKKIKQQEIIEFPSVLVNSTTGQLEDCFQKYVRPTCNQLLTDYCKELTGIQQTQVDKGVLLSEALLMHDKWLEKKGIKYTTLAVVTWGDWDCKTMLESECRFKRIRKPPYFDRWINLKVPFEEVFGNRCNLKEAVERAGLVWEGRPHCGLDDAKNTARLLALFLHRGYKFNITSTIQHAAKLKQPPVPSSLHNQPTQAVSVAENNRYCYCGVKSNKCIVRKPGPTHGSIFYGCGNWTATRGATCDYSEWATP